jgi:hypothetical protein
VTESGPDPTQRLEIWGVTGIAEISEGADLAAVISTPSKTCGTVTSSSSPARS